MKKVRELVHGVNRFFLGGKAVRLTLAVDGDGTLRIKADAPLKLIDENEREIPLFDTSQRNWYYRTKDSGRRIHRFMVSLLENQESVIA